MCSERVQIILVTTSWYYSTVHKVTVVHELTAFTTHWLLLRDFNSIDIIVSFMKANQLETSSR